MIDNAIIPLTLTVVEGEFIERHNLNVDIILKSDKIEQVSTESFTNPKILAFDIEVYNPKGNYPVEEMDPVIMIGIYSDDFKKVLTWKEYKTNKDYVEFVNNETELIKRFEDVVNEINPDYVVGYFSDGFDFPYIKTRAKVNGVKLDFNGVALKVNRRGKTITSKLRGIPHLDIFKFISTI